MSITLNGSSGITSPALDLTTPLPITEGGTGASTADGAKTNLSTKFEYTSTSTPTYTTNPTISYATWLDTSTGYIWTCVDNTTNKNIWKRLGYEQSISASPVFDIFGDSSAVALYQFESGALGTDTGGTKTMTTVTGSSTAGLIGGAWLGAGSYMKNGAAMNNNLVVSVSCWVKVTDTGSNTVWSSGFVANGTAKRMLKLSALAIQTAGGEYGTLKSFGSVASGVWTHICVSADKVYVNGAYVDTTTSYTGPASDTYGFYIGANGSYDYGYITDETYGQPMNGSVDQMRIFNRELTATEVAYLYREGSL